MGTLNKYIDELHKTATGLTALSFVMGGIGVFTGISLDSAWFGMTKIIFGLGGVAYGVLFILMVINAFRK